jgi:hypothetical protein
MLGRPQSRCRRCREEKHLLLLPGIKLHVLGIRQPVTFTAYVTADEHWRQNAQTKTTLHSPFHMRIHPHRIDITLPPALKFPSAHASKLQSCQPLTQVTAIFSPYQPKSVYFVIILIKNSTDNGSCIMISRNIGSSIRKPTVWTQQRRLHFQE